MEKNIGADKNLPLVLQWIKETLGLIGIVIIGIAGIVAILFLFSSYPNIQVYMYETNDTQVLNDNSYGNQNVRIIIDEKDNIYNGWSEICFLIKNEGQDIGPNQFTANNMKTHVSTTDASCKECEHDNSIGLLKPQLTRDICDNIQISQGIENFNFEIKSEYDAIWHNVKKNVYNCDFVENIEYNLMNTMDYAYSCSLEK